MGEPFGGPTPQLVYGQLGAESRVYVLRDGIHVGDTSGNDRVHVGQLPSGDYGLRVTNAGATVIIDGSSNMFKIGASGSLSATAAGWTSGNLTVGQQAVSLPAMGALSTIPAHLSFIGPTGISTDTRNIGWNWRKTPSPKWCGTGDGVDIVTQRFMAMTACAYIRTYLSGGFAAIDLTVESSESSDVTYFAYYHVLAEAAI